MFNDFFVEAPQITPSMNIGCLMDIPTGRYYLGKHGEHILCGGLMHTTGVGGRGNTYKSTIAHHMLLTVINRYLQSHGLQYDTEPPSVSRGRMVSLSQRMSNLVDQDIFETKRLTISNSNGMLADEWFDAVKEFSKNKSSKENAKKNTLITPFIDSAGNYITTLTPSLFEVDSMSMMSFKSVEKLQDENSVGDSGMNVESMRGSSAKSQMVVQLPPLATGGNNFFIITAHMGDDIVIDPYAAPQKKLTFLKNKLKFKNIPEKFTFIMNNLWITLNAQVLMNDPTKTPKFPRSSDDNLKGDTDLQVVTIQNLRAKNGPTGMPMEIIISQSEGVLVGLTEFNFLCTHDRFGLGGNLQNYFLELVPDINLSRTTIRTKINDNVKLQRALEITSEMRQIFNLDKDVADKYFCTPGELYETLKTKGYSWDRLLDTRGYWIYEGTEHPQPFLSTMDLLKMSKDEYHPYWHEPLNDNKKEK